MAGMTTGGSRCVASSTWDYCHCGPLDTLTLVLRLVYHSNVVYELLFCILEMKVDNECTITVVYHRNQYPYTPECLRLRLPTGRQDFK